MNLYQVPLDFDKDTREIEESQINIVRKIKEKISLPISVKLSSDYTNMLSFVKQMDATGVDGLVLFNSFFQPDIDIDSEKHKKNFNLSQDGDYRKSLRYAGLFYGNINADICSSKGIFTGKGIVKHLLSGATCIQMVSAVYKKGLEQISVANRELSDWMDRKGYNSIDEFRGKLSQNNLGADSLVYRRAQYVDLLLTSENIFGD